MTPAAVAQQFTAAGWSDTAAADLARIHLDLQARKSAALATALAAIAAPLVLPARPGASPAITPPGALEPRRLPLLRVLLLALVTGLLLSACGGGGDEPDTEPTLDPVKTTQPLNCHLTPEICK